MIEEISSHDVVIVRPGERVPVDGTVVGGHSVIDQSSITGESMPVEKLVGDHVFAATLNQSGMIKVEVERAGRDTTFGRIIKLVEEADASKPKVQRFADRYTNYFLPLALGLAGLTYIFSGQAVFSIAVLVAACPCAVGLATPLSVVASAGASAKRGLLVKGGLYFENLAKVDMVVVDKTGTLTLGAPRVSDVIPFGDVSEEKTLGIAASIERYSEHPLASSIIRRAAEMRLPLSEPEFFEAAVGKGVQGSLNQHAYLVGNENLLKERGAVNAPPDVKEKAKKLESEGKTVVYLVEDGRPIALIAVSDTIREQVRESIAEIKGLGIKKMVLMTGDNEMAASAVANSLGIAEFKANLQPEHKIAEVRRLQAEGHRILMIGDGINDAPALAQADVGMAMGRHGSDIAIEASHVTLMKDDWKTVPQAIKTGGRTYGTIKQNIVMGIATNAVAMGLASIGVLTPVFAAAAQAVPDVLISLNAARLLYAN